MTMTADTELGPDSLFERENVADLQKYSQKLRTEIDRKREDLRTMVGER